MSKTMLTIECPQEVLVSLKETPETMEREIRIAAAAKLFEIGKLSSGRAAQLAGMERVEFLLSLSRYRVSALDVTPEELEADIASARHARP